MRFPRVLRDRNALLLVTVSLVTGFGGTALSIVAAVWVMTLSGSASLAGMVGLCLYAPTLLAPVLGTLVDRVPRRPLLVWTNIVLAGIVLTLLALRTVEQVWLIFGVMIGYGIGYTLLDAGDSALLPAAVPAGALGAVNGARMSAQEGVKLVAPLAGAGLFVVSGGGAVALLAATCLVAAAGLYRALRCSEPRSRAPTGPILAQTREGVRFLLGRADLRLPVLIASATVAASGLGTGAIYAVVDVGLHRPATFVGVLASAQGAGSLLGGLLGGRLLDRERAGAEVAVASAGAVLFALGALAYCLPWPAAAMAGAFTIGVGLLWTVIAAMTVLQRRTPAQLLGRVSGALTTLIFAPTALAIPVGAGLVAVADHRLPLVLAAALAISPAIWRPRRRGADPAPHHTHRSC